MWKWKKRKKIEKNRVHNNEKKKPTNEINKMILISEEQIWQPKEERKELYI